jgi:uroporphyrinogen-III synthase
MRVVVTRPQDNAERTAAALRARGHEVLVTPLLKVEPIHDKLASNWGGVIITSANAAAAIAAHPARAALTKLRLYAVGQRSALAARLIGFTDIIVAGGSVRDLVRTLAARKADARAPLLYLAGEDRAADLIGELAARGIAAEMAVIYRAVVAPFPPALTAALKEETVDIVLHYSKRSAVAFVDGARTEGVIAQAVRLRHLCLSRPIAEPLSGAGAGNIGVAARPDEAALFDLLGPAQA